MRLCHRSCGLLAFRLATQHPTQLSSARESEDHAEVPRSVGVQPDSFTNRWSPTLCLRIFCSPTTLVPHPSA